MLVQSAVNTAVNFTDRLRRFFCLAGVCRRFPSASASVLTPRDSLVEAGYFHPTGSVDLEPRVARFSKHGVDNARGTSWKGTIERRRSRDPSEAAATTLARLESRGRMLDD